jgi:Flp pilus assembly secretin CpaC
MGFGSKAGKSAIKYVGISVLIIGVSILLINFIPALGRQFELVSRRYETLFLLASGDFTAGGTLQRIDVRIPEIMKWVNQSPLLGFGFSNTFYENADNDIGFHTLLLNLGYAGAKIRIVLHR